MTSRRGLRYGIVVVLLVTSLSLVLSAQGWRSRMVAFDLLTYVYSAQELLDSGTLPRHGDTGSYGSYKPPGTAWLMLPGAALFDDPRAFAYVGTGLLHFATLLGIFLLARRSFGVWTACLAVALYGISRHGIFLAGSLWPNGRPDFYVWFVILGCLWALRRDGRFLAAALAVWGVGMHVDMAIAPALFILPVVWISYRPPVRPLPLLVAGLIVLAVWTPYLRFEATRGFADLKSQLFLRHMLPEQYRRSWCDPSLILTTWGERSGPGAEEVAVTQSPPPAPPSAPGLASRLGMVKDKVLFNFSGGAARIPGVDVLLLALVLGTALLCVLPGPTAGHGTTEGERGPSRRQRATAILLIVAGVLLYAITSTSAPGVSLAPGSGVARKLPQVLLLIGVLLWGAPWLFAATRRLLHRLGVEFQPTMPMRLLVICLMVPWLILVVLAEPGKPERFWWVWPVQVILLAASVAYFLPRFPVPRTIVAAAQVVVVLLVVLNPTLLGRIDSWRTDGWEGKDPEEVRVIDYVAGRIRREGKSEAAIGYQLILYPFMAEYHITNPVYRVGAELELMLRFRHAIANTNQCAEGISVMDEYRIVQRRPKQGPEEPQHYFAVPLDGFRLLRRFDLYDVFRRG